MIQTYEFIQNFYHDRGFVSDCTNIALASFMLKMNSTENSIAEDRHKCLNTMPRWLLLRPAKAYGLYITMIYEKTNKL